MSIPDPDWTSTGEPTTPLDMQALSMLAKRDRERAIKAYTRTMSDAAELGRHVAATTPHRKSASDAEIFAIVGVVVGGLLAIAAICVTIAVIFS